MTIQSRVFSFFGTGKAMPELEQTATPVIRPAYSKFTVTGTTAITGFATAGQNILPGRTIKLYGTHATGPAFTDTAIASTANGLIHLSAALTLANGTSVTLTQANNGSWWEDARSANG